MWRLFRSLADEGVVLILYSLVHGNADFLEYVLVQTDLETLLIRLMETLYDAASRRSNQIYMVLIILLILSQDSSLNVRIHKLVLPIVPWFKERILYHTTLGSLMVIILIRTLMYNQSKLRVVYAILHRSEIFLRFKSHPRFSELLENIFTVLDFFNSRVDASFC